jgi:hypothetical protein
MRTRTTLARMASCVVLVGCGLGLTYWFAHSQGWSAGYAAGARDEQGAWILVPGAASVADGAGTLARRASWRPLLRRMVDVRPTTGVNTIHGPYPGSGR